MPRGVDPDQFESFIDNIDADYVESIGGVAGIKTEDAVDMIKNSRIYATGENFYEVRVAGSLSLFKKDGTPLVISYTPDAAGGVSARDQARRRKAQEETLATVRALRGR